MKLYVAFYVVVSVVGVAKANGFLHSLSNWWPFSSQDAESTSASDVQVLLGVPDTVASVGRLFTHKIPDYAFQGDVAHFTAHVTGSSDLPDWMYLNQTSNTLTGIPGVVDSGSIIIQVVAFSKSGQSASTSFMLQVRAATQHRDTTTQSFKSRNSRDLLCDWFEQTITATLVLNTDLRKLDANERVELVHTWANYVSLSVQAITLHARRAQGGLASVTDGQVLAAGPGDAEVHTSHKGVELTWTIACGDFTGRDDVTRVLEHNIDNGNLRLVLGYSVIGWFVSEVLPVGGLQVLRRRRQIQGFATPIPTPTVSTVSPTMLVPDSTSPQPSITVHPSPSVTASASVSITLTSTVTTTVVMPSTSTQDSVTSQGTTDDVTYSVEDTTTASLSTTQESMTSDESTVISDATTIDSGLTSDAASTDDTSATETNFVTTPLLSSTQIGTGIVTTPLLDTTELSTEFTTDSLSTSDSENLITPPLTTLEGGMTTEVYSMVAGESTVDNVTGGTVESTGTIAQTTDVSTMSSGTTREGVTTEAQTAVITEGSSPEFNGTTETISVTGDVSENQTVTTELTTETPSVSSVPNTTTDILDITTESGLNASTTQITEIQITTESEFTSDLMTSTVSSTVTTLSDQTTAITPLQTSDITTVPSDTTIYNITTLLTTSSSDITTTEIPDVITTETVTTEPTITFLNTSLSTDFDVTTQHIESESTVTESRTSGTSKRSVTSDISTNPTLTDSREFTSEGQTTESVDMTTTEYINQPPEVVTAIPRVATYLGTYFSYIIPNDTFYDPEDGNTRQLTLQLFTPSMEVVEPDHWVQLDPDRQQLYGVSVTSAYEAGTNELLLDLVLLYATDGAGLNVSMDVELSIDPLTVINVSHQFVMRIAVPLNVLQERTDRVVEISNAISQYFNDTNYGYVTITHIRNLNNSAIQFIWTNNTISKLYCYNNTILNLYSHLVSDMDRLQAYFTDQYPITSVSLEWLGACSEETFVPPPTIVRETGDDDDEGLPLWAIVLLVVIIVLFLLTFIILLICCILSRRKEGGRYIPADEKPIFSNKRKPVILEGEIELQDSPVRKPRKPMVLESDHEAPYSFTNPAYSGPYESRRQPPPYEGGSGIEEPFGDEELPMELEVDYPVVYEPESYRRPPPAYRLPPPYIEGFGTSEI